MATDELPPLESKLFRELVAAGAVQGAQVRSVDEGLVVVVRIGEQDRILARSRSDLPRVFKSFDGAASILTDVGIHHWQVDARGWVSKTRQQDE